MPVLYFALVGGVAWLLYAYYTGPVLELRGAFFLLLLAYVIPGFVGGVVILFMLKPFFAPRAALRQSVDLQPDEEREFVAGVHALCAAIGVRPPRVIQLNYQVNAWVQFEPGWRGWLGGRKLLSVGLPLVAGMNSRQLVGVLAHEFGHFAQGAGMRCSYLINTVNRWLESRAYHPDEWDERLARWSEDSESVYTLIATYLTSLCLWFTRLLMKGLFQLSFRASRRLSQEMEFDADRYEALVVGSGCFRGTALQLRALSLAFREADDRNALAWREGKLVSDLPAAIKARLDRLDAATWQRLSEDLQYNDETRYWDSHPADQQRITSAEALEASGMFLDERPATLLFRDFPAISARVTRQYYADLGLEYSNRHLVAVDEVLELNQLSAQREAAWKRYGNGMIGETLLLSPDEAKRHEWREVGWQACVDQLRQIGPDAAGAWPRLEQRAKRRRWLSLWVSLIDHSVEFQMPDGGEPDGVKLRTEYGQLQVEETADLRVARRTLGLFARRLQCAVDAMPDATQALASKQLLLIQSLHDLHAGLEQVAELGHVVTSLKRAIDNGREELRDVLYTMAARHHGRALVWLEKAKAVPVPDSESDLRQCLLARCPRVAESDGDHVAYAFALAPIEDAFLHLYRSHLAALAELADAQEQVSGIRPIRLWSAPEAAVGRS